MMTPPSWKNIGEAISFYVSAGYEYRDVTWSVPEWVLKITRPNLENIPIQTPGFGLVGSAEQSFLYLDLAGQLPAGKYVACTPCFRDEPVIDRLHRPYFMKVELYDNTGVSNEILTDMVKQASWLMNSFQIGNKIHEVLTSEGIDLEINGIEVGSYGSRTAEGHGWTYGTGIAEPRFTQAISSKKRDYRHG